MIRRALLLLALFAAGHAAAQGEEGLWRLWSQQSSTNDAAAAAAGCIAYARQQAADPFAGVARSLAAWNLLRADRRDEAAALLTPQIEPTTNALGQGLGQVARAWLTRLDRERVRTALQFFYRKEVRYPYSLNELRTDKRLPANLLPPERDRWDAAWRYQLVGFKHMPELKDQKYDLQSASLGELSDLRAALAVPFGARIALKPVRVRTAAIEGREVVEFARDGAPGAPVLLTTGTPADGLLLAHYGPRILVVCDQLHWRLFPRPAGP